MEPLRTHTSYSLKICHVSSGSTVCGMLSLEEWGLWQRSQAAHTKGKVMDKEREEGRRWGIDKIWDKRWGIDKIWDKDGVKYNNNLYIVITPNKKKINLMKAINKKWGKGQKRKRKNKKKTEDWETRLTEHGRLLPQTDLTIPADRPRVARPYKTQVGVSFRRQIFHDTRKRYPPSTHRISRLYREGRLRNEYDT